MESWGRKCNCNIHVICIFYIELKRMKKKNHLRFFSAHKWKLRASAPMKFVMFLQKRTNFNKRDGRCIVYLIRRCLEKWKNLDQIPDVAANQRDLELQLTHPIWCSKSVLFSILLSLYSVFSLQSIEPRWILTQICISINFLCLLHPLEIPQIWEITKFFKNK